MHYANGREAKLGDPVIGTGYNLKGTLVGIVVGLVAGQDSCNIRIAAQQADVKNFIPGAQGLYFHDSYPTIQDGVMVRQVVEYGQTSSFLHAEDALKLCQPAPPVSQPPVDNAHVATGSEQFSS